MRRPAARLALLLAATTLLAACADLAPTGPAGPQLKAPSAALGDSAARAGEWQGSQN